eukprot:9184863-Ditylum_brightwellii.AAC.1
MEKYLCSMGKSCTKHQDYKKETCNKLKHAKANMEKMKIECTKVKKDQEDGRGYGDDKGCNLSSEIIITCVYPSCPGKKNHKTAKSQECICYKKLINVPAHQIPQILISITKK